VVVVEVVGWGGSRKGEGQAPAILAAAEGKRGKGGRRVRVGERVGVVMAVVVVVAAAEAEAERLGEVVGEPEKVPMSRRRLSMLGRGVAREVSSAVWAAEEVSSPMRAAAEEVLLPLRAAAEVSSPIGAAAEVSSPMWAEEEGLQVGWLTDTQPGIYQSVSITQIHQYTSIKHVNNENIKKTYLEVGVSMCYRSTERRRKKKKGKQHRLGSTLKFTYLRLPFATCGCELQPSCNAYYNTLTIR
jgi:hypothetical protein